MSRYTYLVRAVHVNRVEDVNGLILDHVLDGLISAEQIISVGWDENAEQYLICYRVRHWLDGTEAEA